MYVYKNALENLLRNKGRNILIATIIFVIVATTVVALIINNTASSVIEDYSSRFGSKVTISVNLEKLLADAAEKSTNGRYQSPQAPLINPELQLSFADSTALQKTEAYGYAVATAVGIKAVAQIDNGRLDNCRIYGDYWQDFTDGTRVLMDAGIFPSSPNECVISQELADLNSIKIGDTITFAVIARYDIPDDIDTSGYSNGEIHSINGYDYTIRIDGGGNARALRNVEYELIVTGVYYDMNDEYSGGYDINRRNEILTTLNTLLIHRAPDEDNVVLNVEYYLKNPNLLSEFESYVRAAGLPDVYDVTTDAYSYDTVVKPVQGLKSISISFMAIVLILGAIILTLLTTIAIRERKYEIGVLRAMGMKKRKVALGLWTELLVITFICLLIGISVGSAVAQPVTNVLIEQQVEAISTPNSTNNVPGKSKLDSEQPSVDAEPLSKMQVTIDFITIFEIVGIVLFLSSLAGIISISKITKYEPIKILMERN